MVSWRSRLRADHLGCPRSWSEMCVGGTPGGMLADTGSFQPYCIMAMARMTGRMDGWVSETQALVGCPEA